MRRTVLAVAAATGVFSLLTTSAGENAQAQNSSGGTGSVAVTTNPERVRAVGLPCLPGWVQIGMTNTGQADRYVDMELTARPPVALDRRVISSWLPAWDPDHTVTTRVGVTVARDAAPGTHDVTLRVDQTRLTVPVDVLPLPGKGDGDNLALGEQASASSTHGSFRLCGAVDGDADSANWSTSTGWNDATRGVFPDDYSVALVAPAPISRIETYTLDSSRYPAARNGLRDWDVQVRTAGSWVTVDEVRGNVAGRVTSTVDAVTADAVRIVVLDSNDHAYSRIVELAVYTR